MNPEVVESIQGLQWSPGITDAHKAALRALLADWERRGEALRELMDYQNGPPLPSYEEGWTAAMEKARSALEGKP